MIHVIYFLIIVVWIILILYGFWFFHVCWYDFYAFSLISYRYSQMLLMYFLMIFTSVHWSQSQKHVGWRQRACIIFCLVLWNITNCLDFDNSYLLAYFSFHIFHGFSIDFFCFVWMVFEFLWILIDVHGFSYLIYGISLDFLMIFMNAHVLSLNNWYS